VITIFSRPLSALATITGVSALAGTSGCLPLPASVGAPTEVWAVWSSPADTAVNARATAAQPELAAAGLSSAVDAWIALDTTSFRPTILSSAAPSPAHRHLAVVTSFQGTRYHADVVRGMAESRDAVAATAGSIASLLASLGANGLLLDFQGMTSEDLPTLVEVSRAIADSARAHSANLVGIIVPATDSAGYPGRILTRVADVLVAKLFPEHGVGTPPGPIVSPPWFARGLGLRAGEAGVNKIVAGIPADGVLWDSRRGGRRVSYAESLRLAQEAGTVVARDPASGNLHASSARDGWELWVVDHELIKRLIADARRIGVTRFALFGLEGADPALWQSLP
jgi:hypothetical protein